MTGEELKRKHQKDHLKELMEARGWNQSDLARKLGVTPSFISQLFSEHRAFGYRTAHKLAEVFHVTPEEILGEETAGHSEFRQPNTKMPLLTWRKAAKYQEYINRRDPSFAEEWISFDCDDRNAFALRVEQPDNRPFLMEADIVIVSPATEVRNGDIALVEDRGLKIRRVIKAERIVALSTTADWPMIEVVKDHRRVRVVGKIEGRITRL